MSDSTPDDELDDLEDLELADLEDVHEDCVSGTSTSTVDSAEIAEQKYPGPKDFAHLHVHTLFSPLDGVAEPKEYAERAKHFGMHSIAVTDHGSLGSYPDMYLSCKENGLKFIPGIEAYLNEYHKQLQELRQDPKFKYGDLVKNDPDLAGRIRRNRHIILLCKNQTGFKNLLHMTSQSWEIGFYYKPRIWMDVIRQHKEGLIALSGCLNGPISHELVRAVEAKRNKDGTGAAHYIQRAAEWVKTLKSEFGEDFYIELQMPGPELRDGYDVLQLSIALAKKFNVKTVMTGDCWSGNTPVMTKNRGYVPISQLLVDEEVLTHRGRYKKIEVIASRPTNNKDEFYSWAGSPIIATGNHKMLIARQTGQHFKINMEAVKNLKPTDKLCIRMLTLPETGLESINISDFLGPRCKVKNDKVYPYGRAKVPIDNKLILNDDILWLIGYYIAEGYVDKYRLGFAHHKKEIKYINRLHAIFAKLGLKPDLKNDQNSKNGCSSRICCSAFSYFLEAICGHKAYNKHLPPFWNKLSSNQLKVMLLGYLDGDGHYRRKKDRPNITSISYTTTSIRLNLELINAFASLGIATETSSRKPRPYSFQKKDYIATGMTKWAYNGSIKTYGVYLLGLIDSYSTSKPYEHLEIKDLNDGMIDKYITINNKFIRTDENPGRVYDIQVEDDHSYNVGFNCSNCHYLHREDFMTQRAMMAIDAGKTINDPDQFTIDTSEGFLKSRAEFRQTYYEQGYEKYATIADIEMACDNTLDVVSKCENWKPNLDPKLPVIDNADAKLAQAVATALMQKGLHRDTTEYEVDGARVTYVKQATIELNRIKEKGFSSYFLITKDLVDYSRGIGYPVGPGRGCFLPNSTVLLDKDAKDYRLIKEINVGDKVLDAAGEIKSVIEKFKYEINEEVIAIETDDGRTIECTKDHKILIKNKNNYEWKSASTIQVNDDIVDLLGLSDVDRAKIKYEVLNEEKGNCY